jgi:hypothetical protein
MPNCGKNNIHTRNLHWINTKNIVLIPKKKGAEDITDYRPISLIHGFAKIVAKVLSRHLAPRMNDILSNAKARLSSLEASMTTSCLFVTTQDGFTVERRKPYY